MHHDFLDRYSDLGSLVHRLDPRTKLITMLAFVVAVVVTPVERWPAFVLYFVVIAAAIALSRLPPAFVLKRSLVVVPFVVLVVAFNLFLKPGDAVAQATIGGWHISITDAGLLFAASVTAKAWLSILALILLSSTTRFSELLKGMERLGMPRVMTMILSFMYRYIFVLADEAIRMRQARDSRNFGGGRRWQLRTIGNMVGTLFVRSYERGERAYAAMVARGYDGETRTLSHLRLERQDIIFSLGFLASLAATAATALVYV